MSVRLKDQAQGVKCNHGSDDECYGRVQPAPAASSEDYCSGGCDTCRRGGMGDGVEHDDCD
jgi:hypothetical protein